MVDPPLAQSTMSYFSLEYSGTFADAEVKKKKILFRG